MHGIAFVLYVLFVISWFLHLSARLPVLGLIRIDLIATYPNPCGF